MTGGRLLVVCGPTGTGKTRLGLALAERLDGEIVGCDALQVYRGFDAGTAKPTPAERATVPHHLIDCLDPSVDCSMADWVAMADEAVRDIAGRGRLPIVVGGTGLYLRGLLRGVVAAPPRDPRLRERLRRVAERRGAAALHRWLAHRDPASAERLAPRDLQRVVRALELSLGSERSWSERLATEGNWNATAERYRALKIGLDLDRETLGRALDRRVDRFFETGLVDEVRGLMGRVSPEANAFKAIGYREVREALASGADPQTARERVRRNTRRYAKRQRSWFRREVDVLWIDAGEPLERQLEAVLGRWDGG